MTQMAAARGACDLCPRHSESLIFSPSHSTGNGCDIPPQDYDHEEVKELLTIEERRPATPRVEFGGALINYGRENA